MVESVSVYRGLEVAITGGINHKSQIVRTVVARLMDKVVCQMGAERVMGSSKEFQVTVKSSSSSSRNILK